MAVFENYRAAHALEGYLGDPLDPENAFSYRRAAELDERDEYPEEACRLLDDWGLYEHYIPVECGGRLDSYEELFALLRIAARRDLTPIAAHWTTCLASISIWLGGSEAQKRRLAAIIRRREQVSLGLTERAHGADLLANEVQASRTASGFRLSGEKWLINNATRSTAFTLFTRTDIQGGPRGFSILLVEKGALSRSSYTHLPRERTLGICGTDISGIRFEDALAPADALVEPMGSGLELTLKSFQITRPLCAALSLGAADVALRTTLRFALERRLYGDSVFSIPYTQSILAGALADLLACECLSIASMRAIHVLPEQMSVLSSVVKYFVPTAIEEVIRRLSVVLGARFYLRRSYCHGAFQKAMRDSAIVSIFDGSTAVNLNAVALQLRYLAEHRAKGPGGGEAAGSLARVFSLGEKLPELDPSRLALLNRGRDDLVVGLSLVRERLASIDAPDRLVELLVSQVESALGVIAEVDQEILELTRTGGSALGKSSELYDLARRYCAVHAFAAAAQMWLYNRDGLDADLAGGAWLAMALDRLLETMRAAARPPVPSWIAPEVARLLVEMHEQNRLFSILSFPLAESGGLDSAPLAGAGVGEGR
jgi:alkylation response protein AidB-like acyl-CoA dehydrogenase